MEIPQKLKDYINEKRGSLPPVTNVDELLHLDSLTLMRLVALLETEFGVRVEDDEIRLENFDTLGNLGALLANKKPTQVAFPVQSKGVTFIARRKDEHPEVSKS
jgi:acyl carrier protein